MNTREVIIELLSQLGSSREAREYLGKFSTRDSTQFAVVKVGGEVLQNEINQLAASLGFLYHVGLFPIVLHGAGTQLNQALADAGLDSVKIDGIRVTTTDVMSILRPVIYEQNMRLVGALENLGIRSRSLQHGVFECEYEDQSRFGLVGKVAQVNLSTIRDAVKAGNLPIVTCLGETAGGQMLNVNADVAAASLVLEIEPQKIIFLTPTGGLLDDTGQIMPAINLETDYQRLLDADWVHSGMRLKLIQIAQLLMRLPATSSVSITSAQNLTRELFTHRGAGTLIRRGEGFQIEPQIAESRQDELKSLLKDCFDRELDDEYFNSQQIECLIWANSGRAAAVVQRGGCGIPYLDKFAVTSTARGEGLGAALWEEIRKRFSQLYWRSRVDNPVNSWYLRQADFHFRKGNWLVFGYGVDDARVCDQLAEESANRREFWLTQAQPEATVS